MAYSQTIETVVGDTRPALVVTIKDSNTAASGYTLDESDSDTWDPIDITGATVKLFIRKVGETTLQDTLTGVLTDPSNGVVVFTFAADTWEEAGVYDGEVQITYSDGGIQTLQKFIKFKVRDELG
jgi:hypothetical protein